ncbi:MAG: hypothetical protein C0404_06600 [Verrucomicrobia bacterium]|nr:hypothetical protein [Verrucomicrobiota bacterium]
MNLITEIVVILCMLAVNGLFAAYEMALASVSLARVQALAEMHKRGAQAALHMKQRLEASLATVQVGITLAGAVAAATGGVSVDEYLSPLLRNSFGLKESVADGLALGLLVVPLSAITIVFAELIPKVFAVDNKERVVLAMSPAMRLVSLVMYPAVRIFELAVMRVMGVFRRRRKNNPDESAETGFLELRATAALARATRVIGALEEKIIVSAAQMSTRKVSGAMIPAAEMVVIHEESTVADALVLAHIHMHTRYPACSEKDNPQTVTGYLTFKDIVAVLKIDPARPSLKSIIRPIMRISVDTTLAEALGRMKVESAHIALVTNAVGAVTGMITLEDIVEELVGDIAAEYDRLPAHIHRLASGWLVGGGARMESLLAETGLHGSVPGPTNATFAAWFEQNSARPPNSGETIRFAGLEILVRKTRRRKLAEAVVRLG